jgi:MoaA/NifB/PqqE/SkfB family radical SAM enzyme
MPTKVATIDFHVTSECGQECPYCWGPQDFEHPVDTDTALRIISRVRDLGPKRIVFTGGDPLKRPDIARLIPHASESGLEVALSTSGDAVTEEFLAQAAPNIDLISLPLDGSSEAVNSRTKEKGHFASIMRVLGWLRGYPAVDVKVCTPVTRHNLSDVPNIVRLVEEYADSTRARVFYNIFQTFPRAMFQVDWTTLLVTDEEFAALGRRLTSGRKITINVLNQLWAVSRDRRFGRGIEEHRVRLAKAPAPLQSVGAGKRESTMTSAQFSLRECRHPGQAAAC